jgi:hypothetical protein
MERVGLSQRALEITSSNRQSARVFSTIHRWRARSCLSTSENGLAEYALKNTKYLLSIDVKETFTEIMRKYKEEQSIIILWEQIERRKTQQSVRTFEVGCLWC